MRPTTRRTPAVAEEAEWVGDVVGRPGNPGQFPVLRPRNVIEGPKLNSRLLWLLRRPLRQPAVRKKRKNLTMKLLEVETLLEQVADPKSPVLPPKTFCPNLRQVEDEVLRPDNAAATAVAAAKKDKRQGKVGAEWPHPMSTLETPKVAITLSTSHQLLN